MKTAVSMAEKRSTNKPQGRKKPAAALRAPVPSKHGLSADALATLFRPPPAETLKLKPLPKREPVSARPVAAPKPKEEAAPKKVAAPAPMPAAAPNANWPAHWAKLAERSQRLVLDFMAKERTQPEAAQSPLPAHVFGAFLEMTSEMLSNPQRLLRAQTELAEQYMKLWQSTALRWLGQSASSVAQPSEGDKRFKDPAWSESPVFDYIKQSYLLTARWLQTQAKETEGLDDARKKKLDFYTRQFVDALSPSNFLLTNPQVIRATLESGGENLVKGLEQLLADLDNGRITMTDETAFKVGENVAASKGAVVFRNDLMELIQYSPSTPTVARRPLLILPPWINKFYILDLKPENSFIQWAVDQGLTVFCVSWVNPDSKLAQKSFADYMHEGVLAAMGAIEKATGERDLNVIGYCLSGTLLASTMAWLKAKRPDEAKRIKSATYFTTMIDFSEAGELEVFIDEEQIQSLEEGMAKKGYLDAKDMATTFNMLRANDLIWSFVVNNYLLGKQPFPFDLLYWNSDNTRMPAAMHSFYLRNMYQKNLLPKKGGLTLDGVALDLTKIETPTYILSTKEDHIAPWKSTYAATQLYGGPVTFTLSGSGHIAGVINPPSAKKYGYWTNGQLPPKPESWLDAAEQHEGSWWPHWRKWLKDFDGGTVPARGKLGGGKLKPLAPAPGTYVKVRAV